MSTRCPTLSASSGGFTLIELLIVISILLILSATAVVNFQSSQVRAKVARVHADTRTLASALEVYHADHRAYPPAADGDIMLELPLTALTTPSSYLSQVPADPFGLAPYDLAPGIFKLGYIYLDADTTSRGMPAETYGHIWQEDPQHKYMIHSCGPNRRWDVTPYRDYDPTNGTTSNGDICTFGPL